MVPDEDVSKPYSRSYDWSMRLNEAMTLFDDIRVQGSQLESSLT